MKDDKVKMMMSDKQLKALRLLNPQRHPELGDVIKAMKSIASNGEIVIRDTPSDRIIAFHMNGEYMFTECIRTGRINYRKIKSDQWEFQ